MIQSRSTPLAPKADQQMPAARLRERVLGWLDTMRIPAAAGVYRLNRGVPPSPFASCFAVFVRHLFDDLRSLSSAERVTWLEALQAYQDPSTGLFSDAAHAARSPDAAHNVEHLNRQLTTFCLSAVHVLGGQPLYPLHFLEQWKDPDKLCAWLDRLDWTNPWNSSNKAMFLGIFLLYERDFACDPRSRRAVDAWFAWHDRHQNPTTGFWGRGRRAEYIDGMGGAYHQFILYHYAKRPLRYAQQIVDRTLLLQQPDGLYSPHLGGATCNELDAVDILVHLHRRHDYRRPEIEVALRRILAGTLANQNPDGGFCWGHPRVFSPRNYWRLTADVFRHRSLYFWYLNWRAAAALHLRWPVRLHTGWADQPRAWNESSIFDTWFRCLSLAEISQVLPDTPFAAMHWNFLSVPGLGWFAS
jgi:hypothetical protein